MLACVSTCSFLRTESNNSLSRVNGRRDNFETFKRDLLQSGILFGVLGCVLLIGRFLPWYLSKQSPLKCLYHPYDLTDSVFSSRIFEWVDSLDVGPISGRGIRTSGTAGRQRRRQNDYTGVGK